MHQWRGGNTTFAVLLLMAQEIDTQDGDDELGDSEAHRADAPDVDPQSGPSQPK
jgi:hypothetical protein